MGPLVRILHTSSCCLHTNDFAQSDYIYPLCLSLVQLFLRSNDMSFRVIELSTESSGRALRYIVLIKQVSSWIL